MKTEENLRWDGEQIAIKVDVNESKFSPKDFLDALDKAKNQKGEMEQQEQKLVSNLEAVRRDLVSIQEYLETRLPFEQEAYKLQLDQFNKTLPTIQEECAQRALNLTKEEIALNPHAYDGTSKKRIAWLKYCVELSRHEKIGKKFAKRIISEQIHERPQFAHPFKEEDFA